MNKIIKHPEIAGFIASYKGMTAGPPHLQRRHAVPARPDRHSSDSASRSSISPATAIIARHAGGWSKRTPTARAQRHAEFEGLAQAEQDFSDDPIDE